MSNKLGNTIKLYDVPRDTWVQVVPVEDGIKIPPAAPEIKAGELIHFHHVDGMYSFCTNLKEEIVHLAAWTEVIIV